MKASRLALGQMTYLRALQFSIYGMTLLVVSYFPLYFYDLGFSELQIGAVYSIGPLMAILSNALVGVISDKTRNLRRILSVLFVGQILVVAALVPQQTFGAIAALMALFYLFQTPIVPMTDSISLLASAQLGRSFPSIRVFGSLGFACCAIAFGYTLKAVGSDWTLWLGIGVLAVSLAASLGLANFQASLKKFEFGGLWNILKQADTLLFFAMVALVSSAHRMNEVFLAVGMRQMGASDEVIGYAWMASAVSEIPIFFLLAKYGYKLKELPLLSLASLFYMLRMLLLSFADDPWQFVAIQALHSLSFGIYYVTALRYLQNLLPDEYRASGQALFAVVWTGLAGLAAGTIGGWLFDSFGLDPLFRTGGALAFLAAVGFLYAHFRRDAP